MTTFLSILQNLLIGCLIGGVLAAVVLMPLYLILRRAQEKAWDEDKRNGRGRNV